MRLTLYQQLEPSNNVLVFIYFYFLYYQNLSKTMKRNHQEVTEYLMLKKLVQNLFYRIISNFTKKRMTARLCNITVHVKPKLKFN